MKWESAAAYDKWPVPISNRAAKEELGRQIADKVQDGQVVGVLQDGNCIDGIASLLAGGREQSGDGRAGLRATLDQD